MAPQNVYIAVIGTGGVGAAFLAQLSSLAPALPAHSLHVVLLARSTTCLQSPSYAALPLATWPTALAAATTPPPSPEAVAAYLTSAPGPAILVDNTATTVWPDAYPLFLRKGIHVVTPNKKGFAASAGLWDAIQSASAEGGAQCLHEASVGAGLPVLTTLLDLLVTGDAVTKIEGVFSGTMSYLFNTFAPVSGTGGSPPSWSDAVKEAKKLGFTEPDPRDDLNGLDVARKLTILARVCGVEVDGPTSFPVQSLVPKELEGVAGAEEFLGRLHEFDGEMDARRAGAEREGKVLRFVGSADLTTGSLHVALSPVDASSAIAGLRGSDNLIAFHTARYGAHPLVIQGAGAGADVTAMGVSADLVRVVRGLK